METNFIGAGMGTSGLVGQFGTLDAMGYSVNVYIYILILHIIVPIILVWAVDLLFRKYKLISIGDLKL
jgi:hypothetical protein